MNQAKPRLQHSSIRREIKSSSLLPQRAQRQRRSQSPISVLGNRNQRRSPFLAVRKRVKSLTIVPSFSVPNNLKSKYLSITTVGKFWGLAGIVVLTDSIDLSALTVQCIERAVSPLYLALCELIINPFSIFITRLHWSSSHS